MFHAYNEWLNRFGQLSRWNQEVLRFIAELRSDRVAERRWGPQLTEWERLFTALARECDWQQEALETGLSHPVLLNHLLQRLHHAAAEFTRFAEKNQVTRKERPEMNPEQRIAPGEHSLPPLPYDYDALEPYIDAQTMRLHHDKHHRSYVDGLNKAERMMAKARESDDYDLLRHWEREAAFNGAGHYLHTLFWEVMSPEGGGMPQGELATQLTRDFGSFERFKKHFAAAAEKVEGGGWAILIWSPRARRLDILQAEKHQNLSQWDLIPVLPLDVWEHAYYLKYQNDRKQYIDAWWNVVDWKHLSDRFEKAKKLTWEPF